LSTIEGNKNGVIAMTLPVCLNCQSEYVYQDQEQLICPECGYEWNPEDKAQEAIITAKDANGTTLNAGDKITLAKDLKVKGSSMVMKIGTKAQIRSIVEGKDHQLDCKVDSAGEMMITAAFVKKA
jgi:protein PhnA